MPKQEDEKAELSPEARIAELEAKLAVAEEAKLAAEAEVEEEKKRASMEKRRATSAEKRAEQAEEERKAAEEHAEELEDRLAEAAPAEEIEEQEEEIVFARLLPVDRDHGNYRENYSVTHGGGLVKFVAGEWRPVPVSLASYLATVRDERPKGAREGARCFEIQEEDPAKA